MRQYTLLVFSLFPAVVIPPCAVSFATVNPEEEAKDEVCVAVDCAAEEAKKDDDAPVCEEEVDGAVEQAKKYDDDDDDDKE